MAKIILLALCLSSVCVIASASGYVQFEADEMQILQGEMGLFSILISPPVEKETEFELTFDNNLIEINLPDLRHSYGSKYTFVVGKDEGIIEYGVQSYVIEFKALAIGKAKLKLELGMDVEQEYDDLYDETMDITIGAPNNRA